MPERRQLFSFAAATAWLVCCLTLGAIPASGYQREAQTAANAISEKLTAAGKRSVAVVDFTDLQGQVTELGRFLAEEISVALASSERPLDVVDRSHLKVLIQENKLSATGLIDPATAKKLGQIAGVDAIVTGTLTPFGDTVRLTLKVLDSSTARIVAATTAEIPKTKAIEELVARGVGGTEASSTPDTQLPTSAGMPKIFEGKRLRFSLKRCAATGGSVRCEVLVENLTQEPIYLFVYGGDQRQASYLSDSSGNQYGNAVVELGNGGENSQEIYPGIALALRLTFRGLPAELKVVNLSLLVKTVIYGQPQPILFHDVPLTR